MPDYTPLYGDLVKFKEAISFLKQKSLISTQSYDELQGVIHSKAFTVAGATKTQLLKDLYNAVDSSIENGHTITEFRKQFDKTVAKHGWSYNGKRGWRTQTIYQNNRNTARAAGRWQQHIRTAATRPYLLYLTAGDERVRDQHNKWHYILLPIEHPFWSTHYPPNGWGCRCKVMSVNERDIERMGLRVTNPDSLAPDLIPIQLVDNATGEITTKLPGIDLGWDYNPGKAWLGSDSALGKSILQLNNDIRETAIPEFNRGIKKAETHYKKAVTNVAAKITRNVVPDASNKFMLGHLPNAVINNAFSKGVGLKNSATYIDEVVIYSALKSGVQFEVLSNLMARIHKVNQFSVTNGMVTIAYNDLLVTIEFDALFNRVVSVESG